MMVTVSDLPDQILAAPTFVDVAEETAIVQLENISTDAVTLPTLSSIGEAEIVEPTTCQEAEPFALQVRDDSMAPEFWPGCVILIDPTGRAGDGAFVLADLGDALVFRQLRRRDGKMALHPLNPDYDVIEINSVQALRGIIVQRSGTRRRHHKRYEVG